MFLAKQYALHGVSLLADRRRAADAVRAAAVASRAVDHRQDRDGAGGGRRKTIRTASRRFCTARSAARSGPCTSASSCVPRTCASVFPGGSTSMNFLMNADLIGAVQKHGWTAYGSVGREPANSAVRDGRTPDAAFISYEHWIGYQTDGRPWRPRRTLPSRVRHQLRRPHGVLAHLSRSRSQRPGVRRRGERHDGPVAPAGDGQSRQGRGDPARPRVIAAFRPPGAGSST